MTGKIGLLLGKEGIACGIPLLTKDARNGAPSVRGAASEQQDPFDCAQGRLSTAKDRPLSRMIFLRSE